MSRNLCYIDKVDASICTHSFATRGALLRQGCEKHLVTLNVGQHTPELAAPLTGGLSRAVFPPPPKRSPGAGASRVDPGGGSSVEGRWGFQLASAQLEAWSAHKSPPIPDRCWKVCCFLLFATPSMLNKRPTTRLCRDHLDEHSPFSRCPPHRKMSIRSS
jgi:hypothetical protein